MVFVIEMSNGRTMNVSAKSREGARIQFERNPYALDKGLSIVDIRPALGRMGKHRKATQTRRAQFTDPFVRPAERW